MRCRQDTLLEGDESLISRVALPAVTPWPGKLQVYTSPTIIAKRSQKGLPSTTRTRHNRPSPHSYLRSGSYTAGLRSDCLGQDKPRPHAVVGPTSIKCKIETRSTRPGSIALALHN